MATMKTQQPIIDNAAFLFYRPNEILGSDTKNETKTQPRFVFNFNSNPLNNDETEINLKIKGVDATETSEQIKLRKNENEVMKVLESWLNEEETEEGEKSFQELMKTLEDHPISFAEIT
jgi:hypothetical protein